MQEDTTTEVSQAAPAVGTRLEAPVMQHTPGPWQWDGNPCDYDKDNEAPWLVTDAYAVGVAKSLREGVVLKGQIECLNVANARLIAAAPDLLASMREVLAYFDAPEDGCFSDEALARARSAVARAVGAA